jgi:predicted lysophospholipase L1 biosynthesis ABC-type transport system permease subunit
MAAAGGRLAQENRGVYWGMLTDLRYAVRSLWRAPWYSATVVGVMALGMALATTVFAVVDGVLFKPLPPQRRPKSAGGGH